MRVRDREVELETSDADNVRRIGEKLLFLDELEDTLEHARASGGESRDRIDALERRVSAERETIQAMENRGELNYGEIARAMEAVDRSG